jgi:hypothetical protein
VTSIDYHREEFLVDPDEHDLQVRIIEELQRDALVEQYRAHDQGRQQGRIEGSIVTACFVVLGLTIASFWTI